MQKRRESAICSWKERETSSASPVLLEGPLELRRAEQKTMLAFVWLAVGFAPLHTAVSYRCVAARAKPTALSGNPPQKLAQPVVRSWYDAGVRLSPQVQSWYDGGIRLGTASPPAQEKIPKGLSIEHLIIKDWLGVGTQSEVLLGELPDGGGPMAVKLGLKRGAIAREAAVLSTLPGIPGFPSVLHHEPASDTAKAGYLLMELLGPSLDDLYKQKGGGACVRLGGPPLLCVGRGVVRLLRRLHLAGYVHNDVKPANLLLGKAATGQPTRLHLIDFGSSTRIEGHTFSASDTLYEAPAPGPMGTPRFASVAAEECRRPMRPADDLESLAYTLTYLAAGSLRWQGRPDALVTSMKRELLMGSSSATPPQLTKDVRCATAAAALEALWAEVRRCNGDDGGEGSAGASVDYEACLAALGGRPAQVGVEADLISERTLMAALDAGSLGSETEAQMRAEHEKESDANAAEKAVVAEEGDQAAAVVDETSPSTSSNFGAGRVVNVRLATKSNSQATVRSQRQ